MSIPLAAPDTRPVLVHCEELERFSFGPEHPMGPDRVRLAVELADELGLLDGFDIVEPWQASDDLLRPVHEEGYIQALNDGKPHPERCIGIEDNPVVPGLPHVASRIAAASATAAQLVWDGRTRRAVNISGGLHHAMPGQAHGFCLYNDANVAISWLLAHGADRVAYVDLDAHHGDGVERVFWDDPRVLTISVHETGQHLFPGTGFAHEIGGPDALATAVNVALPTHTEDLDWLRALNAIVSPLLRAFKPQILISQHGADPHRADPLTHLDISMDAMALSQRAAAGWADRFAQGRWVALGGGGYQRDSAARAWAHLVAAVGNQTVEPDRPMPRDWAERVRRDQTSATMGDEGAAAALADFHLDRFYPEVPCPAINATSRAVFPYWDLQPYH
ncbi:MULTISPECIES: acetoin utilization protein AcuC [unclassified Luteococcus]|uniref:acetoin utilization protein AcuC n=1 Tax=unclassified Luteococcus TaxID=2639923 RepID=UPI00313BAEF8